MKQELFANTGLQTSSVLPFRRINFVPALRSDAHATPPNVDLHPLNAEMPALPPPQTARPAGQHAGMADKPFFPESNVQLQWCGPRKAGSGLINLGNTCFMNSVLQCLTHTPPLAELFLSQQNLSSSSDGSDNRQLDPIAATQAHIKRALTSHTALQPKWHARNLKAINRRFRLGRQEDAHEYLRCVLDAMHEAYLKPFKSKPPPGLAATTFVHRIFGGRLRSQIVCEGVDYTSSTCDPFLDLSLEINKASSLTRALQHFTAPEVLDGDNRYRCPKNNKLVRAFKRISIEEAPNVLTIHLKRFDFFGRGHKISKKVEYGLELDLGPYMTQHIQKQHQHLKQLRKLDSQQQQQLLSGSSGMGHRPVLYDLYAVLVHIGHSLHSGHYVCFVKAGNGAWHSCDDHRVHSVSQRSVEGLQAYILFYIRRQPKGSAGVLPAAVASVAQNAAVAANKLQQQQQQQRLRQQQQQTDRPQQQLMQEAGSNITKAPAAAGHGQADALAQQQQQFSLASQPARPAQSGAASAADAPQKAATALSESTARAQPAQEQSMEPGDVDPAPAPIAGSSKLVTPLLHHHHHVSRSHPPPLTSFDRHMALHRECVQARAKLLQKQFKHKKAALLVAEDAGEDQQASPVAARQQPVAAPAKQEAKDAAVVMDMGVVGSKRRCVPDHHQQPAQQQQQQQQQPQQHQPVQLKGLQEKQHKAKQQQQKQEQQQQTTAEAHPRNHQHKQQQEQQQHQHVSQPAGPDPVKHQHKRHKPDKGGSQPARQQQHDIQDKQQQTQPAPTAAKPASKIAAMTVQQPQAVTGAAALELFMTGTSTSGRSSLNTWEGGDQQLGLRAAVLTQAAGQQRKQQRDEWDVEYDRGKVKKVKKHKQLDGEDAADGRVEGNRFQRAWQEQLPGKSS